MYTNAYLHCNRAIAAAVMVVCAPILSAQIGLGLSPMRIDMKIEPGTEHSSVLAVSSDSKENLRVRAEPLDFLIDQNQTPQFEPRLASESEFSCRDWLSINPVETEIGPGKQLNVRYTLRVPADVKTPRGYHCGISFRTLPTDTQAAGTGIKTAVQAVTALYLTVGSPAVEGGFKELRMVPSTEGSGPHWIGEVVLTNRSFTHFRPVGELSVLDDNGKVLESVPITPLPVLPRRDQRYTVAFTRDFDPGTYRLRARLDFGIGSIEEGTAVVRAER
jgi:hypothetical protein